MKQRILLFTLLCGGLFSGCSTEKEKPAFEQLDGSKWISKIIEYKPAPGQFTNTSTGNEDAAQRLIGGKSILSLGGFGGSIVFRFDHAVQNRPGVDFVILGNAFRDQLYGAVYPGAGNSEPGIVMVSVDENKNGVADDRWYELQGENHRDHTGQIWYENYKPINGIDLINRESAISNYRITYYKPNDLSVVTHVKWSDNQGKTGEIAINSTYKQCYYPLFGYGETVPERIEFTGTRLPSRTLDLGNLLNSGSEHYVHFAFGQGYTDNYSEEYLNETNGDPDTKNSNKLNLDWAINEQGESVKLESIDFIKVYTAVLADGGLTGELSTEICGAISLSVPAKK